jgi:glutathione S-transferase
MSFCTNGTSPPYCRKVCKALRLKGIPYKTVDCNGVRAPQAARLATSRKLPVGEIRGYDVQQHDLQAGESP